MTVVYDAGVLVAAERNDRHIWAEHRVRLERGLVPVTSAPVVAQVSRSPRQVQLRRFLRGCVVVPMRAEDAHDVGMLLGRAGTTDVVDAHLVVTAGGMSAPVILTSDPKDLTHLVHHSLKPIRLERV